MGGAGVKRWIQKRGEGMGGEKREKEMVSKDEARRESE